MAINCSCLSGFSNKRRASLSNKFDGFSINEIVREEQCWIAAWLHNTGKWGMGNGELGAPSGDKG
ncbi:hypothetical protein FD725_00435 [Nostoc sp. TCL26-01]|nr:hypothetical protein FD725_00435 [Nostoc sp. TCL26-01]